MNHRLIVAVAAVLAMVVSAGPLFSADTETDLPKGINDLEIGALWYLSYQNGESAESGGYNLFTVKRGYINIKKKMTPWLETRITPDVHQD
ncbi:MAG: hypothetical protein JSW03_00575, partial [Candidatus Eiseniibacteriota bacterium]